MSTDWKDEFAQTFVDYLTDFNVGESVTINDLKSLLEINFDAGITLFRLVLEQSKAAFKKEPDKYVSTLDNY